MKPRVYKGDRMCHRCNRRRVGCSGLAGKAVCPGCRHEEERLRTAQAAHAAILGLFRDVLEGRKTLDDIKAYTEREHVDHGWVSPLVHKELLEVATHTVWAFEPRLGERPKLEPDSREAIILGQLRELLERISPGRI